MLVADGGKGADRIGQRFLLALGHGRSGHQAAPTLADVGHDPSSCEIKVRATFILKDAGWGDGSSGPGIRAWADVRRSRLGKHGKILDKGQLRYGQRFVAADRGRSGATRHHLRPFVWRRYCLGSQRKTICSCWLRAKDADSRRNGGPGVG